MAATAEMPDKFVSSMQAVVHYSLTPGAVALREVPAPSAPGDDEVLLRVGAVSVCGSDVHQYRNSQSWPVRVPVILGHEFCGTVAARGAGASAWREGDRVVSETAARICGVCALCRRGEYNLCPRRLGFGYGLDGAMADYILVPARCLHRLPDGVPFTRAALVEPACVAFNAVCRHTALEPGDSVIVLGPGPIGLLCAAMARLAGAGKVIVAGLAADRARLQLALAMGTDEVWELDAADQSWRAAAAGLGDGLGVAAVLDASGVSVALQTALALVRPGGQITKVGWGPQPLGFSLDPLVQKAVTLRGSFSHNYPIWEEVIALLASGRLDIAPLISRVAPLAGWQACFDGMHQGALVKAVLTPAV